MTEAEWLACDAFEELVSRPPGGPGQTHSSFSASPLLSGLLTLQLLPPPVRLGLVVLGVVEPHQPLQGLRQGGPCVPGDLAPPLLHPGVALDEERLGVGVLLLTQKRAA